tara:strand:- start:49 stop:246 length:198 start_codon:yes stop_codon:yes gene_type:complete
VQIKILLQCKLKLVFPVQIKIKGALQADEIPNIKSPALTPRNNRFNYMIRGATAEISGPNRIKTA